MIRTFLKIIAWIFAGLVSLFVLVWLLIQIPAVQNAIVQKVTNILSQSLQTKVSVDRVTIRFFKTVAIKGIYMEDLQQDTLLYAKDIGVNIGVFDLFKNRIHLNKVSLTGAKVHLHRPAGDSVYNYQFIVDAFTPEEPDTTAKSPWTFGINRLSVQNTYFRMLDEFGYADLEADVNVLELRVNQLDMDAQILNVDLIQLSDSKVTYAVLASPPQASTPDTAQATQTTPAFPDIGWTLKLNKLRFDRNYLSYHNKNTEPTPDVIDYDHITLSALHARLDDLVWETTSIRGKIESIGFKERSGFQLDRLAANLAMSDQRITVQDFIIKTPQTDFEASSTLNYKDFAELVNDFVNKVQIDLRIEQSALAYQDLAYFAPSIKEIKQLNTRLNERIQLRAEANGTINDLKHFSTTLIIKNGLHLRASGAARQLTDPERLQFNLDLQELSTSYDDFKRLTRGINLPAGLDTLGQFALSGRFRGSLDTIYGQNVVLNTQSYTGFRGDLVAMQVTNPDKLSFDLSIIELKTQAKDLNGFAQMPPQVVNLGQVRYVGDLSGTLTRFNLKGNLQTDAGDAVTDLSLDFNKDYSNAGYSGDLSLDGFNLGKVLSDTSIGKITLALRGEGRGLTLDSIRADIKGTIAALDYRGYEYNNLRIDGDFNQKQFTGEARIEDANLSFDFLGNVNLNDSLPVFRFTANVDTVNLKQLNLSPDFYGFSAKLIADFTGSNLDNLDGAARIQNLAISNDTASYYTDSIILKANLPGATQKRLSLHSDFLTARIEGNYNVADLPKLMRNFVNDYFPIDQLINPKDTPPELALEPSPTGEVPDQSFDILIQLDHPVPLLGLFVPNLEQLDTAFFALQLDTKKRSLQLESAIPKLVWQGRSLEDIRLEGQGTPEILKTALTVKHVDYGGTQALPVVGVNLSLANDSLFISLEAKEQAANDEEAPTRLALGGRAFLADSLYHFVFAPTFVLNNNSWNIPQNNEILYRNNYLDINNFSLSRNNQRITVNSTGEPQDNDFSPMLITFSNFKLQEISRLLKMSEDMYAGDVNGDITLREPRTNLNYLVDMSIKNIKLNEESIGNLVVKAEQDAQRPVIRIDAALDGERSKATVNGAYALVDNKLDLNADIQSFELQLLDPFLSGMIEDSRGTMSGNFSITGPPDRPGINGAINLNNISTILGITGVRYTIPEEEIRIDNQLIDLGSMRLLDENNNEATLSGTLNYTDLANIGLDLNFSTKQFPVLNTKSAQNELYYGKLLIAADVSIAGTVNEPRIDAQASTLAGSQLFVQPLTTQEAVASQEDYIIFANPATLTAEDTARTLDQEYRINRRGIDLVLNLEVTSGAELQIIVDPTSGDKLICRGNADLTVGMNPTGEMDITGSYRITSGSYSLNYQGIVKRQFGIQPGSRLDFIGDPLDTRFDVTATYTTRTPTYELIRNQVTALTQEQARQAKTRSPVTVVMNMRGDLDEPSINFDIQMGDQEASPVTSVEAQALARLRDNPSELNKQVFSLLLFNSFLAESSGGSSLAEAGTSVYLSSVSNLVTNQLNRLADRYIKGVEVDIGVESYQRQYELAEEGNTVTELQLGVSKQLFNDRLSVRVGGNVNVTSENSLLVEGANFSSIAGDFVLEYKLTEKGNYILRVFRRENYDVLDQSNVPQTGVGISFRKSFQGRSKSDKKRKQDQENLNESDAILPNEQKKKNE